MNCYKHLTITERENLLELRAKGMNITQISNILGRSKSTISRELKRNSTGKGYSPSAATSKYRTRRKNCGKKAILRDNQKILKIRELIIQEQWSPEQISNRLKMEKGFLISYVTIYRAIKNGLLNLQGEHKSEGKHPIERKLRRKGKKGFKDERRGKIKISNPIEERPLSSTNRSRYGHWEADTVCGKKSKACIVTLVDRKSRFLLSCKCEKQLDRYVKEALVKLLSPYVSTNKLRSITPDRGKEFTSHAWVSEQLNQTPFYFANAHSPWERGTNENTNGLIREYIPKRTDIGQFTEEDISAVVNKLNMRPRKCLGWKTPFEVFFCKSLHLT